MSDRLRTILRIGAAATAVGSAVATPLWGARLGLGILAGGVWNLASLWCLTRLLAAWLGPNPSRRRAIAWLMLKFPLLYLVVFGVFHVPAISVVGFGIGFTIVLVVAVASLARRAQRMTLAKSYGR